MSILVGSTFPLSLIRRRVVIEPATLEEFRNRLSQEHWESFWGHENTLSTASTMTGYDLRPRENRPAVMLTADGLPYLNGSVFTECWVLSPDYRPGYRPSLGVEVRPEEILSWKVLKIEWKN